MEPIIRKVSRGYQITLPLEYREQSGIDIGSLLTMRMEKNRLVLEPFKGKSNALDRLNAIFSEENEFSDLSEEDLSKMVGKEIKASRKNK